VANASEAVTGTITFEGFEQTVATTGSSSNPYKFAATSAYRDDGDACLLHVGARYYDPQVGRFITRDTLLSEHPYLYCEHEPVNHIDPNGHIPLLLAFATVQALECCCRAAWITWTTEGLTILGGNMSEQVAWVGLAGLEQVLLKVGSPGPGEAGSTNLFLIASHIHFLT